MSEFMIGSDGIGMNNRYFRRGMLFRVERNRHLSKKRREITFERNMSPRQLSLD